MRLHASLAHERRVAVAIAGWMQLLHDLNTAALNIFAIEVQATARMAVFSNGFPYVLWGMDRSTHNCYLWLYMSYVLDDTLYTDVAYCASFSKQQCVHHTLKQHFILQ